MTRHRRNPRITPKTKNSPIPPKGKSKILLKKYSADWNAYVPVTIHHEDNGEIVLRCISGDHHVRAIGNAKEILMKHGYKAKVREVSLKDGEFHELIYIVTKR